MEDRYEEKNKDVLYKVTPKFDFLYELGMPTGKKIRYTILIMLIFLIAIIILAAGKGTFKLDELIVYKNINLESVLNTVVVILIIFSILKVIFHIVFQSLQYKNINYIFYNDYMIYEDKFLNQHTKKIQYANVKEVEIRRTVWDRLLGYGIIIIYTNAENEFSNGLVIYSVKNPQEHYEIIDDIVHKNSKVKTQPDNIEQNEKIQEIVEEPVQPEQSQEEFLESLKNIEKE